MREYELIVVIQSKLDEEARNELLERVAGWLTHGEDEAEKPIAHHWGQRRLAYPIDKNKDGYYVLFEAQLDPPRLSEVERKILYEDDILRHLLVRKEDK